MYTKSMERHVQRIGYNVNRFRGNLLLLKGGKNPEELKDEFMDIERSLSEIFDEIRFEVPDAGLEGVHSRILRAAGIYRDSLREFLMFYDDGDDEHFVHAGLMINEANELLNEAASMMGV